MDGLLRCRAKVQFRVAASHIITPLHSHHLFIPLLRSLARSLFVRQPRKESGFLCHTITPWINHAILDFTRITQPGCPLGGRQAQKGGGRCSGTQGSVGGPWTGTRTWARQAIGISLCVTMICNLWGFSDDRITARWPRRRLHRQRGESVSIRSVVSHAHQSRVT